MANPPPLPPRKQPSEASLSGASTASLDNRRPRADTVHLTPDFAHAKARPPSYPYSGGLEDPRSSSTQSLHPVHSTDGSRRTLLLIYIHGFLGDETSFKSFPAHVHQFLSTTLAETHVIHTKIYPRYKSRKKINFARDDFSHWLEPHESPNTDVILVGHSLGGILAAEVVLMPAQPSSSRLKHQILGLVAFDVPFLGIHPGVIGTGIASLFRPPPSDETSPADAESTSSLADLNLNPLDPNFNPAYPNDVKMANRPSKLNKAFYFFNKHWGELSKATSDYVTSHLEHGGVLADYPGLKRRYDAVRALEDVDPYDNERRPQRVRFVNYYSASTGRIKEREPSPRRSAPSSPLSSEMQNISLQSTTTLDTALPSNPSPRLSLEEYRSSGEIVRKSMEEVPAEPMVEHSGDDEPNPQTESLATLENAPTENDLHDTDSVPSRSLTTISTIDFPPLPPLPDPPAPFDESLYPLADSVKIARKDYDRQVKAHERLKKDREKTLREREKLIQKRERAAQKEADKQEKERQKRSLTLNPEDYDKQLEKPPSAESGVPPKKLKDRKFCSLPAKDQRSGKRDPTWVRVYMEGMDEVVAHTSMFKISEPYEKLVGDTATRIEEWVKEDATRRAVFEAADY